MGVEKLKTIFAFIIIGAIAAGIVYSIEQRRVAGLLDEKQNLEAELQKLKNDLAAATAANENKDKEIKQQEENLSELLSSRNEVTKLRQKLAETQTEKQHLQAQVSNASGTKSFAVASGIKNLNGSYITKDQLKFVGNATPEAALQSALFAMNNGESYDDFVASVTPYAQSLTNFPSREDFEREEQHFTQTLAGAQFLAEKSISDNQIEIEMMIDSTGSNADGSKKIDTQYMIVPFAQVNGEWESNGPGQPYQTGWDHPASAGQ